MEKERGYKVVAIVALLIAVVGVGIGFAAFSATFTINEETVTVNPSENLLENGMHYTGTVYKLFDTDTAYDTEVINGSASGRKWTGLTVNFTYNDEKHFGDYGGGSFVEAEIINESNYTAYLTDLKFVKGSNTLDDNIACVAEEGTNEELVNNFCMNGRYTFAVGFSKTSLSSKKLADLDMSHFSALVLKEKREYSQTFEPGTYSLNPGEKAYITFFFQFQTNIVGDAIIPDGPFKIYVPDIEFDFSTAKPAQTN